MAENLAIRQRIQPKIKNAHARRCSGWGNWQTAEINPGGQEFIDTWMGCRPCGVEVLLYSELVTNLCPTGPGPPRFIEQGPRTAGRL